MSHNINISDSAVHVEKIRCVMSAYKAAFFIIWQPRLDFRLKVVHPDVVS